MSLVDCGHLQGVVAPAHPAAQRPMAACVSNYVSWVQDLALPLWACAGFNHSARHFEEALDFSGRPLNLPQRAMVQARQIFVFAEASRLGWYGEGGRLAEMAMESLEVRYAATAGGKTSFAFSIDRSGSMVSSVRDAYAHAFILLAIAALYRLNRDERLRMLAQRVCKFLDAELTDPAGGGVFDQIPIQSHAKRQNPLMHLLEAYLLLEMAMPGNGYIERAKAIVLLWRDRLYDRSRGIVEEHFARDWSAHPDPLKTGQVEPGHQFEWVWLLDRFTLLSGMDTMSPAEHLYASMASRGFRPNGLIFDELNHDLEPVRHSSRIWPHTEAMKAALSFRRLGSESAGLQVEAMSRNLMTHFLNKPIAGGWHDHFDEKGKILVDYMPASTLYHLLLAAGEAAEALSNQQPHQAGQAVAGEGSKPGPAVRL